MRLSAVLHLVSHWKHQTCKKLLFVSVLEGDIAPKKTAYSNVLGIWCLSFSLVGVLLLLVLNFCFHLWMCEKREWMNERWISTWMEGVWLCSSTSIFTLGPERTERGESYIGWFCLNFLASILTSCPWAVAEAPTSLVWLFSICWNFNQNLLSNY